MSNALIGFESGARELAARYTFERSRGTTTVRTYKGTQAQIIALEQAAILNGWSTDVQEGPLWTLTATLGADDRGGTGAETPVDTWELFANSTEKEILSSNIPGVQNMTSIDKAFMRDVMDGKLDARDYDYSSASKTPEWGGDATQKARADQIFRGIIAGMKSIRLNIPTIRHTKTASRDYEFQSALTGVDHVYSSSALNSAEGLPGWIYWNIPAAPASNPFTRTDGITVFQGWAKHYPQIQISAFGKSQIVVEWEYGEWITVQHPNYHA